MTKLIELSEEEIILNIEEEKKQVSFAEVFAVFSGKQNKKEEKDKES